MTFEDATGARGGPQLITYADRLGGSIAGVTELLRGPLAGAFGGVHLLPFFRPFDGADAGFDPEDHSEVDQRLGSWDDVADLARTHAVMADLIVNHVSASSPQFLDVLARGSESPWHDMFLSLESLWPDGATEDDLTRIYRPRPGLPFSPMTVGGRKRLMWTTFTSSQIDLDVRAPQTWDYLFAVVGQMTGSGVSIFRLDAAGYVGKAPGTDCFMTEQSNAVIERLRSEAAQRGADTLVEVHGHHQLQIDIAKTVDLVYDFALPPLVLHAFSQTDPRPLARWIEIRPNNCVTVLDTHDGIGVVDVAGDPTREGALGLLTDEQVDALVESIHLNTGGESLLATGAVASNLDLYQVNSTFFDAMGGDERAYLLARMIQLFMPGIPQIYYVGLLAGRNDLELLKQTGVGRDINRHYYDADEIAEALQQEHVRALLAGLRLRASSRAFEGDFSHSCTGQNLQLSWLNGDDSAVLTVDFSDLSHELSITEAGEKAVVTDVLKLADSDFAGSNSGAS